MHLSSQFFLNLAPLVQPMTGIIGALIAFMLFRLSRQQYRDGTNRTYKDLHEGFYNDVVLAKVRKYLACGQSYAPVQEILQKRQQIFFGDLPENSLTPEEYDVLEEIDRFLNFLVRISAVAPQFKNIHASWREHLLDYWVRRMQEDDREHFRWYANQFFPWVIKDYDGHTPVKGGIASRAASKNQPPISQNTVAKEEPPEPEITVGHNLPS